jgi:hypothetical protein
MIFVSMQDSNGRYGMLGEGRTGIVPTRCSCIEVLTLVVTRGGPRASRHNGDVQAMSARRRVPPAGAVTSGFGSKTLFRGRILIVCPSSPLLREHKRLVLAMLYTKTAVDYHQHGTRATAAESNTTCVRMPFWNASCGVSCVCARLPVLDLPTARSYLSHLAP